MANEANAEIERGERGERGFGRGGPGGPGGGRGFGGFGRRDTGPRNIYQFNVLCLDRNTGEIIWEKTAREAAPHEGMHDTNSYASGSPTTDGKFLYASFGSHGVYCYDLDGNLIWERDLGDMETRNGFGEGASPTIYGDTLLVPWDHEKESYLFALDAKTGEIKWQIDRDEPTTWVTPLVIEAAGKTQVILNGTNRSRSYDINTGEVIWECGGQVTNPIATAVEYEGPRLLHDRPPRLGRRRDPARRHRRHHRHRQDRVEDEPGRPVRSVAAALRRQALLHQGQQRRPLLPRSEDRRSR